MQHMGYELSRALVVIFFKFVLTSKKQLVVVSVQVVRLAEVCTLPFTGPTFFVGIALIYITLTMLKVNPSTISFGIP